MMGFFDILQATVTWLSGKASPPTPDGMITDEFTFASRIEPEDTAFIFRVPILATDREITFIGDIIHLCTYKIPTLNTDTELAYTVPVDGDEFTLGKPDARSLSFRINVRDI